jgi:hypothetical protein
VERRLLDRRGFVVSLVVAMARGASARERAAGGVTDAIRADDPRLVTKHDRLVSEIDLRLEPEEPSALPVVRIRAVAVVPIRDRIRRRQLQRRLDHPLQSGLVLTHD